MKMTKSGENLWQLTRLFAFNCYLVREADGLTLIDSGLGESGNEITKAIRDIGLPLRRITLTHAHGDHIGSLDEVTRAAPEAEVLLAPRTEAFLRGEMDLHADEPQVPLRGGFALRETRATRYLEPGDHVGSLLVISAPGHTPDHIAFLDERDGTLIAGDAFQTAAGVAVAGTMRWLFPFPAMATWHRPTAVRSAKDLRQLEPARLAVGHGPVLEQPVAKMEKAILEAEAQLNGN